MTRGLKHPAATETLRFGELRAGDLLTSLYPDELNLVLVTARLENQKYVTVTILDLIAGHVVRLPVRSDWQSAWVLL